jgi:predicted ribosome quality control (RQC) complex YloA/Tae2 family protein
MGATRPKGELSAFDVLALAGELRSVSGSFIDKVLQPSERELVLRLKGPGGERRELVVEDCRWVYLRERQASEGAQPTPFAMLLRKHLENLRLRSAEQHGFERILVLSAGEGTELVLELFGEGNVVLVEDESIVQPMREQSWEHREVRPGRPYHFPPPRTDPRELDHGSFSKLLRGSKGDLVRTLAVSLNLGGRYAEEVCARTGLEPGRKVGKLSEDELLALHAAVSELFSRLAQGPRPTMYLESGLMVDFAPLELSSAAGLEARPYPDQNSLVADFVADWRGRRTEAVRAGRLSEELGRLRRQAANQETAIEAFRAQAAGCRRAAEALSASVGPVTEVLGRAEELRRSGDWKAVEKAISGGKLGPAVAARPHEGSVVVRLPDAGGNELELLLDVRKGARENVARLFSESKDSAGKAARTAAQLDETRRTIERLEREGLPGELAPGGKRRARRKQWFEKYRWFISSDGNVVVGGRDASTNDRVVKRHLGERDVYAHADIHGAPSVVVKAAQGQPEIPERTLREACQFALATAKAWAAGLASGSAYWVRPDQVSKTPESGEYLPRGAFIVRGRKNAYRDLELRLAVGFIDLDGERVLMCGPPAAVAARAGKHVIIEPGEDEPRAVAARAATELGAPTEELRRLLPSGRSRLLLPP